MISQRSALRAGRLRASKGRGPAAAAACAVVVDALESRRLMCFAHLVAGMPEGGGGGALTADVPLAPGAAVSAFLPAAEVSAAANPPLPGLPALNSLSGAPTAIYLDFNGNGANAAYDEDANPTSFNAAEQANIREAWRQVSAYFAPFRVNVTTVLPAAGVPTAWDLLSPSISPVGWSYVNVFPNGSTPMSFNPAGDARTRQSGMAHELGHNFGLSHQADFDQVGKLVNEYSSGPDATHGPIMGVDFAQNVHKWTIGHPSYSPSVLQDDVAVIAAAVRRFDPGGDGFRPDDYAGTTAAATPLAGGAGAQTASGLIERMTDVDAFSFVAPGGRVSLDVNPTAPSGLAPRIEVYDAQGRLVAARDDTDYRDGGNNGLQLTLDLPAGDTYYLTVASHGDYGDLGLYDVGLRPLPAGWDTTDLGQNGVAGTAGYNAATGAFTLVGSGSDVWGTADQARFAYTTLGGDGSIVARVTSMQNTGSWAKVGLDVRESPSANARHVGMVTSYANGAQFLWRSATGGPSSAVTTTAAPFAPVWLKLTRTGNTFTGSRSSDGVNWTVVGQQTVSMNSTVYIGLIANAYTNAKSNTAVIDNVSLSGSVHPAVPPPVSALPAPTGVTLTPSATGTGLDLRWNGVAGAAGVVVERSLDGAHFSYVETVGGGGAGAAAYPGLFGSMRYFYRVSVLDVLGGQSAPSAVVSAVNRPGAVTGLAVTSVGTSQLVVNWRDVSGDAGYRVERSADGGATFQTLGTVATNVPSYTDNTVAPETAYTYRVTPVSAAGLGDGTPATANGMTRLPAVTGLAFTERAPDHLSFRWNALASATGGYRLERSTDGRTFTKVADLPPGTTAYTDTNVVPLGEYEYRVIGFNSRTESVPAPPLIGATPDASQLPIGWASADVGGGASGATGYSAANGGSFTVLAGGRDIWDSADQFRFTYLPLSGDGWIVARVAAVENTDGWAKVGVMIRENSAAGARHALVAVTPGNGVAMQYRGATGGASSFPAGLSGAAPYWVKLVRAGPTVTGYASANGTTWTQLASVNLPMANDVLVGIAATAHNADVVNTASVTNVTLSNTAPVLRTPPAANPNPVTGTSTALSVLASDDHGVGNLTYAWSVASAPPGGAVTFSAGNGTPSGYNVAATFNHAGTYGLIATVTDGGGLSFATSPVTVNIAATSTTIDVRPLLDHDLRFGQQVQFTATALDQFGDPIAVQPGSFNWTVGGAGNSISPAGLLTVGSVAGGYAVLVEDGSASGSAPFSVSAAVVGARLFYNNSAFDGRNAAANAADDNAIAPDKRALLPGEAPTFANVSSYARGINGVVVDVSGMPPGTLQQAGLYQFTTETGAAAPRPSSITVRAGAGAGGTDRVTLVWPDGAIRNGWVNVSVLLMGGASQYDVLDRFAFGHLAGEAGAANGGGGAAGAAGGAGAEPIRVTAFDYAAVRMALGRPAPLASCADFDRDGRVTALDLLTTRAAMYASLPLVTSAAAASAGMSPAPARDPTAAAAASALLDESAGH